MAKLRSISTEIWTDTWFEDLPAKEKLLFIYLITNEKNNMLGIYEISIKKISFETDIEKETVRKALKGFEKVGKVRYTHNHIILVNFLKNQKFNTNMKKSAIDTYKNLPNNLKNKEINFKNLTINQSFETLCKGFGILPKVEVKVEDEVEVEVETEKEVKVEIEEKVAVKKPPHNDLKLLFTDFYQQKFKREYYWSAKDAGNLGLLIKKINFEWNNTGVDQPTDEQLKEGFSILLERAYNDKWIKDHFDISIINSQFNNIIKNGKNQITEDIVNWITEAG